MTEGRCECSDWVDSKGRQRAACPHSGRLARVLREAGAIVRFNCLLRDMNVAVRAEDERRIGLPLFHGAQLAVDITLRSALTSNGEPRPGSARVDGNVCERARAYKETKYAELLAGDRCRLVVVALETGSRWSSEAIQFVESLASSRARKEYATLVRPAFLAWRRRWARMISISCARAFATSLSRAFRLSRIQLLPIRAVLTLPCALLFLVSPALAFGAGVPAGPGATIEYLDRELATQFCPSE